MSEQYSTAQAAQRIGVSPRWCQLHAPQIGVRRIGHALVWTAEDIRVARDYLARREARDKRAGTKPRAKRRR